MRRFVSSASAITTSLLCLATAGPAGAQISWSGAQWSVEAQESAVEQHEGRQALMLRNGVAWLDGVDFRDGVVEFDLFASAQLGFYGVAFRVNDAGDFEHFYVRPFLSGNPDATQYTPVFNNVSGWQLYGSPRFAQQATVPTDQWVRVRLAISGQRLEVRIGNDTLVYPELIRPGSGGRIGITSSGAPARFANATVTRGAPAGMTTAAGAPRDTAPAGIVTEWRVSSPFPESRLDPMHALDAAAWKDLTWTRLSSEGWGFANLARLAGIAEGRNTVFAAVVIRAEQAGPMRARFGFSDRVQVILNGRTIYLGSDGWRSRDYKFLGTVGLHDELILPLRAGDNELWFAVSESFGGWGVALQLPDGIGRVVPPSR